MMEAADNLGAALSPEKLTLASDAVEGQMDGEEEIVGC